jgi:hypothetical protein
MKNHRENALLDSMINVTITFWKVSTELSNLKSQREGSGELAHIPDIKMKLVPRYIPLNI